MEITSYLLGKRAGAPAPQTTLAHKTITANGIYDPADDNADGYSSVTVDVSGGGASYTYVRCTYVAGRTITATDGTITLTGDTSGDYTFDIPSPGNWTFSDGVLQKTRNISRFRVGFLGIDTKWTTSTAYSSISVTEADGLTAGDYTLLVLAIHSEASTSNLDITVSADGTSVTGTTLSYQAYNGSSTTSTRNHRLMQFDVTVGSDPSILISGANLGGYTRICAVFIPRVATTLTAAKVRTRDDNAIEDSSDSGQYVLYGYVNGGENTPSVTFDTYDAAEQPVIYTGQGTKSYGTGFIFWLS